jgi:hypothetical protein
MVKAYRTVKIPFAFEHDVFYLLVLVLDSPAIVPILYGSNSFRKAKATLSYKGVMEMKALKKTLYWSFSQNSSLWYIHLLQCPNMLKAPPTSHVLPAAQSASNAKKAVKSKKTKTTKPSRFEVVYNSANVCIPCDSNAEDILPPLESDSSDYGHDINDDVEASDHSQDECALPASRQGAVLVTKPSGTRQPSKRIAKQAVPMYNTEKYLDELEFNQKSGPRASKPASKPAAKPVPKRQPPSKKAPANSIDSESDSDVIPHLQTDSDGDVPIKPSRPAAKAKVLPTNHRSKDVPKPPPPQ